MNVAFPAVFLFVLVLPGFLFRQYSQRSEVRTVDPTPFSAVVLQALLLAAVFDALGALVAARAGYRIEVGDVLRLLSGGNAESSVLARRFDWLNQHPLAPVSFFGVTHAAALLSALLWRKLVERLRLDRPGTWTARWVRGPAPWYYLFAGLDNRSEVDGAVVAAVVEFKEGSFLYQGFLEDYECDENGRLDRLMLVQAQRRKLEADRVYDAACDGYTDTPGRFYPIAGDVFVLRYAEIKTLNISYLTLQIPGDSDA